MSQDIYAKPDLTKKVRFQTGEKEDRDADVSDNTDNVAIYDNCWIEGSTLPKLQDTTEDQQQTVSVHAPSGRRDLVRAAAAFLGLLCLLLLAALIVVVVLLIQDKSLNTNLTSQRDRLQTSYIEMKSLNTNLTSERNQLQTSNIEMKSLNTNLTSERNQLQTSNIEMKTLVDNLTSERNQLQTEVSELREQLETSCCPDKWRRFGNSCYSYYTVKKSMSESQQLCEAHGAQLPIVSSEEEQIFLSSFHNNIWIGLTDEETEGLWKWVDGTKATTVYWGDGQPDNGGWHQKEKEHCVHIIKWNTGINNWNDYPCHYKLDFICEKTLR